jgi:hypothetical protein
MQETYTLVVKTADGKSLVDSKIIGDLFSLSFLFSRLSHLLLHQAEDIERSKTLLGSGTTPYAPPSSPSTGR